MPSTLQFRRGNTAVASAFTGANGEIFINSDTDQIHVHDGVTPGGIPQANASSVTAAYSNAIAYAASNTYVNTQLGNKADLANPTFTGTVTLPAVSANNSTGSNGQVLTTGANGVYWSTPTSGSGGITLQPDSANGSFYLPLSVSANGSWTNGVVDTKLSYNIDFQALTMDSRYVSGMRTRMTSSRFEVIDQSNGSNKSISITPSRIEIDGSSGQSGQVLTSGGSNGVYWANASGGGLSYDQDLNSNGSVRFGQVAVGVAGLETIIYSDGISINGSSAVTENNLKTINGQSIVGSGDISISGGNGASYNQSLNTTDDVLFNSVAADTALIGMIAVVDNTVSPTDAYGNAGTLTVDGGLNVNGTFTVNGQPIGSSGGSVDVNAPYAWTNVHTFNNVLKVNTIESRGQFDSVSFSSNTLFTKDNYFTGPAGFSNNISIQRGVIANNSFGTGGQVLTSNGSGVYWSTVSGGGTTDRLIAAQGTGANAVINTYSFDVQVSPYTSLTLKDDVNDAFQVRVGGYQILKADAFAFEVGTSYYGNLNLKLNGGVIANSSTGNAGQVLTTNGNNVYWSTPSAGIDVAQTYAWINDHSFAANVISNNTLTTGVARFTGNTIIEGRLSAGGSNGLAGQTLTSTGTGVVWQTPANPASYMTMSNITATGNAAYQLTMSTTAEAILVYVDRLFMMPELDYTVENDVITFASTPESGKIIHIRYFGPVATSSAGDMMSLTGVEDLLTGTGVEDLD